MMAHDQNHPETTTPPQGTLGTFAGVFTPSVLTILGIILFMRLGYVVGQSGLARALIIIGIANAISILTSVSLSAIATNLKVKGGGDYYLISRTLGLEFGGAIGIVLFLAQSVSIAFYCIGFGEVMAQVFALKAWYMPQLIALCAVAPLFILAWLGADWATKFQYVVMALLTAAIISFFVGGFIQWDFAQLKQNWATPQGGLSFGVIFAIFFPAVTGFTQGVSMSGDLKDPGKSLPLGTFSAVGISILVYFGAAIVLAAALPANILMTDYSAMQQVSVFAFLITVGVIAATLSSAMASYLGAPRILQSLAGDRIFPLLSPFAKGVGPTHNPRRGVLLSTAIALLTISIGQLNLIAPVVSMFFLISYGLLNYATYYEARAASPSFRPRFRWYDLRLSLAGSLFCLAAMLVINPTAGIVALAILVAIFQYLKRTARPARWADSRRSFSLHQVRANLLAAEAEMEHPRDWRPNILAFFGDSPRHAPMLRFAAWLQGRSGFTTVVQIIEGEELKQLRQRDEVEAKLRQVIKEFEMDAFPLAVVTPDPGSSMPTVIQSFGIGPVRANTVLLDWLDQPLQSGFAYREALLGRQLRSVFRAGCNIILLDAKTSAVKNWTDTHLAQGRIDLWWNDDATSRLMLLLAHLMKRRPAWEEATIHILHATDTASSTTALEDLRQWLDEVRIEAEPEVLLDASTETLMARSLESDLVFIPFRIQQNRLVDPFGSPLVDYVEGLPPVAMVLAAEDIDLEAAPEDGQAGELAEALDALSDAQDRVKRTSKAAAKAAAEAEEAEERAQQAEATIQSVEDEAELHKIKAEAAQAEENAEKAYRKAAKARAKAEDAIKTAKERGADVDDQQEESSS